MIYKKLKIWRGWQIWEVIDYEKRERYLKMKWFGRNFNPPEKVEE